MSATGALQVASRPKAGSATGLTRWHDVEGGDRGIEGGGVDGTASREAGSGTTTGALPVASRPKAGSATGLARRG
jgi:hypothetical protein